MAKNRHSASCGVITSFDTYLKENFFPVNSNGGVCNIRGAIEDLNSDREEFSKEKIEAITSKLDKEGEIALTQEDKDFIERYVHAVKDILKEKNFQEKLKERLAKAGVKRNAISTMYATYKSKFPPEYREDVLNQVVAAVIETLDMMETWEDWSHLSRAEILEEYGVANFMEGIRDHLKKTFDTIEAPTDKQKEIAEVLFRDQDALEAVFFMAKTKLFEAEKIKIGLDTESAEEEDEGIEDGLDRIESAEEVSPEHWMIKADTMSSFNSMSKENRSILYKLRSNRIGILGLREIEDVMLIHQQLMELRGETACTNSSEFLDELLKLDQEKCPWAAELYNILKNDPYRRTSFFNVYRRNHLNYLSLNRKYNKDSGGPVYYENTNKSNPENSYQVYVAQMYDITDPSRCIFDSNGAVIQGRVLGLRDNLTETYTVRGVEVPPVYINRTELTEPLYMIENWNPRIGKDPLHPTEEEIKEKKRDFILTMNAALNLHMDETEVNDLMEPAKFDVFMKNTIKLIVNDMSRNNVKHIAALTDTAVYASHLKAITSVAKPHVSLSERKSPVEKTFRFNGSTYVTHTICNHIGDTLERISKAAKEAIAQNDIEVFREFIENEFLKCRIFATEVNGEYDIHNFWVKSLYESSLDDLKSNTSFFAKFTKTLERAVGMDDKDFERFTEKENYILCLNSYIRTMMKTTDGDTSFGKFPLFVTGDSNSTRFLTAPVLYAEDLRESFLEVAKQEFERMQMFEDFISWCEENNYNPPENVTDNRDSFTVLPFLNEYKDELTSLYRDYINETNPAVKQEKKERFENTIQKLIDENLEEGFKKWMEELRTSKSDKDKPIVSTTSDTVNKDALTMNREALPLENKEYNIHTDLDLLRDYYYNYRYAMVQQLQFFTVDPGFYEGTNDMQKRYKEMIAAGTPLDLEALDPSDDTGQTKIDDNNGRQDVIYIQQQFYDSQKEVLDALGEVKDHNGNPVFEIDQYKDSTATDGQAWRSFTSYRKIMVMLGKWTPEMEEVWNIIQKARRRAKDTNTESRLTDKELEKILSLGVVFQPIKPFYYGIERISTDYGKGEIQIPVQHKCSEYPIIPELLPENNALAELGKALEDNTTGKSYDLAICTSAVKVGGFGAAKIDGLTGAAQIREALDKGYRHELSLEGWREQSNVPEHADCSRALGTQLRLHWLSNIAGTLNKAYAFLAKTFPSGKIKFTKTSEPIDISGGLNEGTLIQLYNSIASNGFIKSAISLTKELSNPNKMSDLLSSLKANDSREANDGIDAHTIDEKGEMKLSPSEGLSAKDNIAALLSYVRKKIIKQGMKGGSLVQVSTYGFQDVLKIHTEKTKEGKTNITYADCVTCFDFSVTDENGRLVKLKYSDYVDYGTGNLKMADGSVPTDKQIEEWDNQGVDWRSKTKLETDYPGILDMIAYRIPTEGHCSTLNLKARKFLPITAGAIIIVPALYTTIAGFDFDIDKLYFVRREYRAKPLSRVQKGRKINRVWRSIYGMPLDRKSKGTSFIYKRLVAARDKYEEEHFADRGKDEVVAQSSNYEESTLGGLLDEETISRMYEASGLSSEEDFLKALFGEEDEDLDALNDGLSEEERDEQAEQTEEFERLYQYWDLAGLSDPVDPDNPEKGGTGKTAEEFFEDYVDDHFNKFTTFQKYDEGKPLIDQSQTVINNLLFDLYQARLEDYDTFQERYTPSGAKNLKKARPIMYAIKYAPKERLAECDTFEKLCLLAKEYEKYVPEFDATEPSTLVHYQTQNAVSDALIGIAANQNINQKFTSLMEIFRLNIPIKWGNMFNSSDSGMGKDVKKRYMESSDPRTKEATVLDTEASSKENLGAAVDGVKDDVLTPFGFTIRNFNLASFMGKIGASCIDVGLILNQPVVQIAMDIIDSSNGYTDLSEALFKALELLTNKEISENEINKTLPMMKPSEEEAKASSTVRDQYVTLDALTRGISAYAKGKDHVKNNEEFIKTQVAVISILQELQVAATVLSDEVNITRTTSVSSIQSDFGSVESIEQRAVAFERQSGQKDFPFEMVIASTDPSMSGTVIDPYARVSVNNPEAFMDRYMKSAFGVAQAAYSAVMTFVDNVICRYFPYRSNGFKLFKSTLSNFTNKGKLNADIINAANKFFPMYCLEKMVPMFMENSKPEIIGVNGETITLNIPKRIFYKKYFAELLVKMITHNQQLVAANKKGVVDYSKIPILQYITPRRQRLDKGYASSDFLLKADTIGSLQKKQKDILIESWEQMFKSEDPILNNIAIHLFMYSYYVGGFDFGPTTFMSLAPLALKLALGKNEDDKLSGYSVFFNRLFNLAETDDPAFLKELGTVSDTTISIKKAIKSFLANYCTQFTQFSKIIYSTKDDLYTALGDRLKSGRKFTVDFTGKDGDDPAIRRLITEVISTKVNGKTTTLYKVKPCVVVMGDSPAIYICDTDWNSDSNTSFNVCNGVITYSKINFPMGKDSSDVTEAVDDDTTKFREYLNLAKTASTSLEDQLLAKLSQPNEEVGNLDDTGNTISNEIKEAVTKSLEKLLELEMVLNTLEEDSNVKIYIALKCSNIRDMLRSLNGESTSESVSDIIKYTEANLIKYFNLEEAKNKKYDTIKAFMTYFLSSLDDISKNYELGNSQGTEEQSSTDLLALSGLSTTIRYFARALEMSGILHAFEVASIMTKKTPDLLEALKGNDIDNPIILEFKKILDEIKDDVEVQQNRNLYKRVSTAETQLDDILTKNKAASLKKIKEEACDPNNPNVKELNVCS